jgi:hypothetical protein
MAIVKDSVSYNLVALLVKHYASPKIKSNALNKLDHRAFNSGMIKSA